MARISIIQVQKGLIAARRSGERIPSPGRVDGRWGPLTQASLDAFLSSPGIDYHGEVEVLIDASPPALELQARVVEKLRRFAALYREEPNAPPAAVRPVPVPIPAAAALSPTASSTTGPQTATMVFAALLGLGAIGGLVWWSMKGRR